MVDTEKKYIFTSGRFIDSLRVLTVPALANLPPLPGEGAEGEGELGLVGKGSAQGLVHVHRGSDVDDSGDPPSGHFGRRKDT